MNICIGREFGSGGHEIGKRLSEKSGLLFYDHELVEAAIKRSNIEAETLKDADEERANPWIHKVLYQSEEKDLRGLSANDITFQLQRREILELSNRNNCIFVGRCADYVLEKAGVKHISLFIAAPFEDRVRRKMELLNLDEKTTTTLVRKMDKRRKSYYDYYTGGGWGKPYNYDFCINSSVMGLDKTVHVLLELILKLEKLED